MPASLFAAVTAWLLFATPQQAPDAVAAALNRGLELFKQERYQEALDAFRQTARARPDHAPVHNLIGITLTKLTRIPEANDEYQTAIKLNPKLVDPHNNLGFNYWSLNLGPLAEQEFQAALKLEPKNEFAHYGLGIVQLAAGRDSEAIANLEQAGAVTLQDAAAMLGLARAYFGANQPKTALQALDALERKPGLSPQQEYELAVLLATNHAPGRALPHFRTLAQQFPDNAALRGALGAAYETAGDLPHALEAYAKAVDLDPRNEDRYLDYTRLLLDLDRFDDSTRVVEQGLKNVQDNYTLLLRLGAAELMKGNPEKAESIFQDAIAQHPEIPLGYVALARAYLKSGHEADAARVLANALERLPSDFLLEYFHGIALAQAGRDSEAARAFAKAVALNPDSPQAHFESGKLLLKIDDANSAKKALERALQLDPNYAAAYFQLGRVYAKLGDKEKAQQMTARAAELRQKQSEARVKDQDRTMRIFQDQK